MNAIRKHGGGVLVELVVNVALPYGVYSWLQPHYGDVRALLASSVPPIAWSLGTLAVKRRVDAVSIFVLLGIGLSLLAFVGGGSVKFLQLRENLVTGAIGLVFLGSAAIGKPVIYQLAVAGAARRSPEAAAELVELKDKAGFRHAMMFMTLVWGFGLLAATLVACALVFTLPIKTYLLVAPFVGYGIMGALALWTIWYSNKRRRNARS